MPKPEPAVDEVLREIGVRIRSARSAAGMSQEAAAAASGIDYKRWQRLEQGEVNLTAKTLVRVSAALGTTFWELLGSPLVGRRSR